MVKEWWDRKRRGMVEGWDGKGMVGWQKKGCGRGVGWERNGGLVKEWVWERGDMVKEWHGM
jgi:hypothetical protein